MKDIAKGRELLVWYGDEYEQFHGIPISLKKDGSDLTPVEEMLQTSKRRQLLYSSFTDAS